ncbi:hypothetical protein SK128_010143, partial [Halocaridina rubra]
MMLPDTSEYVKYSTALLVTVGLGVSLLLLNGLIFLLLFWRRPSHHHSCQGHHHQTQEVSGIPRVGSMISVGGLGGTYGGPPDCVKASYEKLHLTPDELQQLTNRSPCGTMKRPRSPGLIKSQGSFRGSHGVATISRSPRGAGTVMDQRETSFTVQPPPPILREEDIRPRAQSVATIAGQHTNTPDSGGGGGGVGVGGGGIGVGVVLRGGSEPPRESPLGEKLVGDCSERPNGWATFVGDVPEPPPPPRTSTLRREKK